MGFTSGAKITADLVDEISNGLIATPGGYWTNNDTTYWNTTIKTLNNARRSLKYTNGLEELYVALEVINTSTHVATLNIAGSAASYTESKGLRITLSSSWDFTGHIYPPTNQQSFIQFETYYYNKASGTAPSGNPPMTTDLSIIQVTYYLWIESNGFALIAKPEPIPTDTKQQSFFLCLERNPNKEYSDGYTNFFAFMWQNSFQQGRTTFSTASFRSVLRPFGYQYPQSGEYDVLDFNGRGLSFWLSPNSYAYKSLGNGKVYYVKPIVHNQANDLTPIMQSDLFFPFSEAMGLVDGDIIAIEGATTKYLCKSLNTTSSPTNINMAIKYVL